MADVDYNDPFQVPYAPIPTSREDLLRLADKHIVDARIAVSTPDSDTDVDFDISIAGIATAHATIAIALIARADHVIDVVEAPAFGLLADDDEVHTEP